MYVTLLLLCPFSLIGGSDYKLIYRHYATLYFVFCVDSSESELGILDLIQVCRIAKKVTVLQSLFVNLYNLLHNILTGDMIGVFFLSNIF